MALVTGAAAQTGANKTLVIKPRPTHEETAKRQRPIANSGERKTVSRDQVVQATRQNERQDRGLVSRSSFLSSSADWTLVPKGAVLHVPKLYANRVNNTRSGKLTGWQEFYGENRRWIRTVSITVDQASGKTPLTEEYLKSLRSSGQVLIAVCRGGPISVNLPKAAEEGAEPAKPDAAAAELAREKAHQEAKSIERLKRRLLQRGN